jgi:hypothetical protein
MRGPRRLETPRSAPRGLQVVGVACRASTACAIRGHQALGRPGPTRSKATSRSKMTERPSAVPRRADSNGADLNVGAGIVEAIARRVVELLRDAEEVGPAKLTDAATLASELGVERDWIYEHAEELGAIRLGGPRGRLRFDREIVRERLHQRARPLPAGRSRPRHQRDPARGTNGVLPRGAGVKSPQKQRRASGEAPTRSPKRQQTGGTPG